MFCSTCGAQIADGANFCGSCGTKVEAVSSGFSSSNTAANSSPVTAYTTFLGNDGFDGTQTTVLEGNGTDGTQIVVNTPYPSAEPAVPYPHTGNEGMLLAAFILNLISTIVGAFALLPLAWMIPMTVHSYGIYKGNKPNTTAFGVCTLLFVNLIGGILMLVVDKDN